MKRLVRMVQRLMVNSPKRVILFTRNSDSNSINPMASITKWAPLMLILRIRPTVRNNNSRMPWALLVPSAASQVLGTSSRNTKEGSQAESIKLTHLSSLCCRHLHEYKSERNRWSFGLNKVRIHPSKVLSWCGHLCCKTFPMPSLTTHLKLTR
jgi:hypothetical protein